MPSDAHSVNPTHDNLSVRAVSGHWCGVCSPHGESLDAGVDRGITQDWKVEDRRGHGLCIW